MNYNAIESRMAEWTINGFQKYVSKSVLEIQTYLKLYLIYFYFFNVFPKDLCQANKDTGDMGRSLNGTIFSSFTCMCQ